MVLNYFVSWVHVDVYSANEDSWKEIDEVPNALRFFKFFQRGDVGVFLPQTSGVLYFEGFRDLLSFDLHDEVLKVYSCPIYRQNQRRVSCLLNFEGSLAVIYDESIYGGESYYSLWKLDVDCGNGSWTEQFSFERSFEYGRITLYLGDGQFVVVKSNRLGPGSDYNYYYTKKHANKFLPPLGRYFDEVAKYSESLVSLKGFEQLK